MTDRPGDPSCICEGTGLVTTLRESAHGRGPEVCDCVARLARREGAEEERERLQKLHDFADRRRDELNEAGRNRPGRSLETEAFKGEARAFGVVATYSAELLKGLDTPTPSEPKEPK